MRTQNEQGLTRRGFVKAAAVGSAAVAAGGILGGCTSESDETSGTTTGVGLPAKWDYEADVVVVGFGAGGTGAAMAAQEAGSSVIILEKMTEKEAGGCMACCAGAVVASNPDMLMASSFGVMDKAWATAISDESAKYQAWMEDQGVEFLGGGVQGMSTPIAPGNGPELYAAMSKYVQGLENVTVLYETPGAKLIVDGATKEVCGVEAQKGGATVNIKAKKGVILTTGGYEGNRDMFNSLNYGLLPYASISSPANTGDGILMANNVGAALKNISFGFEWANFLFRVPSEELGVGVSSYVGSLSDPTHPSLFAQWVAVNKEGKRFRNEQLPMTHNKSSLSFLEFTGAMTAPVKEYVNLPHWIIFDERIRKAGPIGMGVDKQTWAVAQGIHVWSEDNSEEIDKGWILKADSIEELAKQMVGKDTYGNDVSVDAKGLAATIAQYNENCAAGVDPEFGKVADNMQPLNTPPYYAAEMIPGVLYTINGLVSNANGQTLDNFGEPVPRLYCAGNIGQMVRLMVYGFAGSWACGRIAARHAAGLDSWA